MSVSVAARYSRLFGTDAGAYRRGALVCFLKPICDTAARNHHCCHLRPLIGARHTLTYAPRARQVCLSIAYQGSRCGGLCRTHTDSCHPSQNHRATAHGPPPLTVIHPCFLSSHPLVSAACLSRRAATSNSPRLPSLPLCMLLAPMGIPACLSSAVIGVHFICSPTCRSTFLLAVSSPVLCKSTCEFRC